MKKVIILSILTLLAMGCQCQRKAENKAPEMAVVELSEMEGKYAIVVGAYRDVKLADRRVKNLEEKGYPAKIVNYENGVFAVVICASDDKAVTLQKLEELRGTEVYPQDGWIITNE